MFYPRLIRLPIGKRSFFLFGPRQTGKSTLITRLLEGQRALRLDFLRRDIFWRYRSRPSSFLEDVEYEIAQGSGPLTVFVDEIQKIPSVLDEVHFLLEKYKGRVHFIMTGSSARKLKRSSVNLLAGRAWEYRLYPLTFPELGERFSLEEVLLKGSLPPVVDEPVEEAFRTLRAYAETYLKEEILDEALVRNAEAFSRFLEIAADQSGKIVNYSTMARETGVRSKTVKTYYEILEDTLVALRLPPYLKSRRKRLVAHPKYYLFDLGVINALCGRFTPESIRVPTVFGLLFEHFIILEVQRLISYRERPARFFFWRTSSGAEVDLVIEEGERLWAIEIKTGGRLHKKDLSGLLSFGKEHPGARLICVVPEKRLARINGMHVVYWKDLFGPDFLDLI